MIIRTLFVLWCLMPLINAGEGGVTGPRMSYLANNEVKIGMDLDRGGAVTWLSSRIHPSNIINSHDLGRQIQMSHYSGPVPFTPEGKEPKTEWRGIGWNPIQTGDVFKNQSKVLDHRNDGKELYIKCIPMHWPLDNVPGECTFETWTTLDGPRVNMRFRFSNNRPDKTWYPARAQELPAIYTTSEFQRLMSYTGNQPFTDGALTHITNDYKKPWPWTRSLCSERWAALVNDADYGLGVFNDECVHFDGGLHGIGGSTDPFAGPTAYVAPILSEIIDHNIIYDYQIKIMLGQLTDMRTYFNALASRQLPSWKFSRDRQHWIVERGQDAGFPLSDQWVINSLTKQTRLVSPLVTWQATDTPIITLHAAWTGAPGALRLRWKTHGQTQWVEEQSLSIPVIGDGVVRPLRVSLHDQFTYRGLMIGLAIDLPPDPQGTFSLQSVRVGEKK